MFGSFMGNICGIGYFILYQLMGILLAGVVFKKEKNMTAVFLGSVIGSFSLQWLPVLYAFFLDFSLTAHIAALITLMILCAAFIGKGGKEILAARITDAKKDSFFANAKKIFTKNPVLCLLIPLFIFVVIVLNHHTISYVDGAMHSGQSTYGDMNMHLGFITSIAKQQTFPPEYSIHPGTKLAYPFLSDSISSSIYLFGTSLRTAYLLPMFAALLQVFFGMYLFARQILKSLGGSYRAKALIAFILFFFNGGFGFCYFLPDGSNADNFTRIFSAFYETPTNYVTENIQWHNIICDMLIPQRATLFGWAILFPVLYLLLRGREISHTTHTIKDNIYFFVSGVLAGGLVLIHTHSFLSLGILCAGFLLQDLYSAYQKKHSEKTFSLWVRLLFAVVFLAIMSFIRQKQCSPDAFTPDTILAFGLAIVAVFLCALIYLLVTCVSRQTLLTWGVFLCVVLVLALPQLIGFTFQQAQGEQFVRGSFNWANSTEIGDGYLMFYLKNLGIMFLLPAAALVFGTKKQRQVLFPAAFLWVICEFILFQPNPYDNNKLLLVAYLFLCIAAADFVWETIPKLFSSSLQKISRTVTVSAVVLLGSLAAVLTMGREYVSDYEVYSKTYVALAEWAEENSSPDDIFLTATNHNNAIASLTGRNIMCGSGSFLYYHGVDYAQTEADVAQIYQNPAARDTLLAEYGIDYIVIGPNEQGTYNIPDLQAWIEQSDVVYSRSDIIVLRTN